MSALLTQRCGVEVPRGGRVGLALRAPLRVCLRDGVGLVVQARLLQLYIQEIRM
jgi:hypothetical protein